MNSELTVENLLLDESFVDYCANKNSVFRMKWESIRNEDDKNARVMDEASLLLNTLRPSLPDSEIQEEIRKVKSLLAQNNLDKESNPTHSEISSSHKIISSKRRILQWSIAATLVAATFVTILYIKPGSNKTGSESQFLASFKTGIGERKRITLPDGTIAILHSNSSINLAKQFNQSLREIELAGEAYFEVARDKAKPFIVHSGTFSTTAIGTAFYINSRSTTDQYTVNLLEGSVQLQSQDEKILLNKPGAKASWTKKKSKFGIETFDTTTLQKWIRGQISFENTSAHDAFVTLEKWYAVKIIDTRNKTGNLTISGNFTEQPLEDVLKVICFTLNCQYRIEENEIVIE